MSPSAQPNDLSGLTQTEVRNKLKSEGYNEIPSQKKQSLFSIFANVMKEPMFLLLLVSSGIYFFLGEMNDALMLVTAVIAVIGLTFYQEHKTERALEALRDLSSPRSLVIRDGLEKRIPGREVVTEDIIILNEGDRVPADAVLLSGDYIAADESLLTGESVPVTKKVWDGKDKENKPGGDGLPFVYSGTLITKGHGIARVTATGPHTELGKIGKALETVEDEETLLHKETSRLVKIFTTLGLALCFMIVVIYGVSHGDWLRGILAGITLSMSMLPEEFPVVLTIFLTLGAWRISKHNVLTRNMGVIETLGATSVLCVDKTGTLTQNRMKLATVWVDERSVEITDQGLAKKYKELIKLSNLASQIQSADPLEKAIAEAAEIQNIPFSDNDKPAREYPLESKFLMFGQCWKRRNGYLITVKGAPETILSHSKIPNLQKKVAIRGLREMTEKGLRVLAVGFCETASIPENLKKTSLTFAGLIGFRDPLRPSALNAVSECYEAGMRVVMITGDYPQTAIEVAKKIGLNNADEVLTGSEIEGLPKKELLERMKTTNVFARIVPQQKLKIVEAFKTYGEIVAMTGDGVNDAPALKAAHVGLAMGERGSDVAREAADMVLTKDDFASIVAAVKQGRKIYDNLKKAMAYIFAIHIPIAGLALIPVVLQLPVVLLPAHIAFLELVIDPASSTVYEAEKSEENIMHRPPRSLTNPMFDRRMILISFIEGLSVLLIVLAVYFITLNLGEEENSIRAITFITLVITNLILIMTNRSWTKSFIRLIGSKNLAWRYIFFSTITALIIIMAVPQLRNLFHFNALNLRDISLITLAGVGGLVWFEGIKWLRYRNLLKLPL